MSFFKKLFGNADPVAQVRRAVQQKRWAEALSIGEDLDPATIPAETRTEIDTLLTAARDGLAELNLEEGEAFLRAGERAQAADHLSLAARHAQKPDLVARIARARDEVGQSQVSPAPPAVPEPNDCLTNVCASGCGGGAVAPGEPLPPSDLDAQTRYELVLTSYPPDWVERYEAMGETFRDAFLLAHEGQEAEAAAQFEQVSPEDRNDLFFFERGALLARLGKVEAAFRDLEQALAENPEHLLALETLVNLEVAEGREDDAERRLQGYLDQGIAPWFCHGHLAAVYIRRNDAETALRHGLEALKAGGADPETVLLTASLLETKGRTTEAEQLLTGLSDGGCSGGANTALAEFWLRRGKQLNLALEAFKGAMRQEPGAPRWPIRIAQTYLALGWKKEAFTLAEKVLDDPRLDPSLRGEALAVLAQRETG